MSWKKVKLGSILTESKVISESPDTNKRIKVRLKVLGVEKRGIENEVEGATKQFIRRAGQFIFGKQNFHKGAFGIVPAELDGFESSSDLPAFDIDKSCLPEFLFYFFKQGNYYLELSKIAYGVATQRINMKEFFELEIPLPDIEIQKQIINQFKSLENGGLEISSELSYQLDLIKQLRQAFLREAMQGKLVKSTNTNETGEQLLAKIKAEKAQLIAEKKLKKEKELPPITEGEIPFEIPEHWAWCKIGEVSNASNSSIVDGPFGSSINVSTDYINEGIPVVRMINIKPNRFLKENLKFIKESKYLELIRHNILPKDVLLAKVGAGIGETCVFPSYIKEALISTTGVARFRVGSVVIPEYLASYLNCFQKELRSLSQNTSQPFLNMSDIKNFPISLPPLDEQEQIVAKLEELMAFCDGLEQSIKESQGYNEMLLQQVLREALQGGQKF